MPEEVMSQGCQSQLTRTNTTRERGYERVTRVTQLNNGNWLLQNDMTEIKDGLFALPKMDLVMIRI